MTKKTPDKQDTSAREKSQKKGTEPGRNSPVPQKNDVKGKTSTAQKETPKKDVTPKPANKKTGRGWVTALLLVLTLSALALGGYDFWLLQAQAPVNGQLLNAQKGLQTRINQLEQQLQSTQNDLLSEVQARQGAQAEHRALTTTLQDISEKLGRSTVAWRMAEVEYLLTVANHRLTLAQDKRTAITVFETADSRLKAIGDPSLLRVRKKIADELAALRAMPEVDIPGLALQLGSLAESVPQLPLMDKKRLMVATQKKTDARIENWQELPAAVWNDIKGLVQVRRHQQPTEPLLPPEQAWFLYQNLQLKLEQARLAVLQQDTAVLRQSLQEAAHWLQSYFAGESAAVINLQKTLASLQDVELTVTVPDVSGSLRELRTVMRERGQKTASAGAAINVAVANNVTVGSEGTTK